jgi:hypothetical protein
MLQKDTRHMKLYCGKLLVQSKFKNILFKIFKFDNILEYSSTICSLLAIFYPISPNM